MAIKTKNDFPGIAYKAHLIAIASECYKSEIVFHHHNGGALAPNQ